MTLAEPSTSTNLQIAGALREIEACIATGASNPELSAALQRISGTTPLLRYSHAASAISMGAALLIGWIALTIFSFGITLILLAASLILLVVCGRQMLERIQHHGRVRESLQSLYEANLMQLVAEDFDPEEKAEELATSYFEFQRGNHLREITSLHSGRVLARSGDLAYQLIQFHWVDERLVTRTYTDEKGRECTVTETVYDHYYRTAVLADIDIAIDAYIYHYGGTSRGERWTSSSPAFNRHYRVQGESEQAVARLMKPALVLLLEELAQEFKDLNFEFSMDETLLISLRKCEPLAASISINLNDPAEAARQLAIEADQPIIKRLLSVVDEVNRHAVSELRRRQRS